MAEKRPVEMDTEESGKRQRLPQDALAEPPRMTPSQIIESEFGHDINKDWAATITERINAHHLESQQLLYEQCSWCWEYTCSRWCSACRLPCCTNHAILMQRRLDFSTPGNEVPSVHTFIYCRECLDNDAQLRAQAGESLVAKPGKHGLALVQPEPWLTMGVMPVNKSVHVCGMCKGHVDLVFCLNVHMTDVWKRISFCDVSKGDVSNVHRQFGGKISLCCVIHTTILLQRTTNTYSCKARGDSVTQNKSRGD
eukprot:4667471-Amphidinium_carterae.3